VQLFISHSSRDREWELVQKRVEAAGFKAYLAEHDLQPGRPLNDKIQEEIESSDAVVVVLTSNAAASAIVRDEIGYALGKGKLVVALVTPDVARDPTKLGMLNGLEYIPFDIDNPQDGLLALTDWANDLSRQKQQALQQAQFLMFEAQQTQLQSQQARLQATTVDLARAQAQADAATMVLVLVGALLVVVVLSSGSK
jgi:hypothetical protein